MTSSILPMVGAPPHRLLFGRHLLRHADDSLRHILPAVMPSMVVLTTVGLAKAVLAVSALGFLGFGIQPPHAEWGMLLMEGKDYTLSAPPLHLSGTRHHGGSAFLQYSR